MTRKGIVIVSAMAILAMSAGAAVVMVLSGITVGASVQGPAASDMRGAATTQVAPNAGGPGSRFAAGQRVVLLDDDPPGAFGLKAGRSGTVLYADAGDGNGNVLISWDFWPDGSDASLSAAAMDSLYPADSAIWVDLSRVRIGHPFKQCGILRKGLEGNVYLEADDGNLYNIVFSDSHSAISDAGLGPVRFDARVQVQGLLSTVPAARSQMQPVPASDGNVVRPILSACPDSGLGLPSPIMIGLAGNPVELAADPNASPLGQSYDGRSDVTVQLNFRAKLSVMITPAPGVGGTWASTVTPDAVGPGTVTVRVGVRAAHLDFSALPPGNMQVASVALSAVPAL